MRRIQGFGTLLLLFTLQATGAELLPFAPTQAEMARLPEYCRVRATDNGHLPEFQMWLNRLGPYFRGIHHYCSGLNYINRYRRLWNDPKRDYYLSVAVSEIGRVAKNMPNDFPLAGEIYLNLGIVHKLMKKDGAAAVDFVKAIEHDPKQVQAYLNLAAIYIKGGNKAKALEVVTNGLSHVPKSKGLQKKYLELGGKEPLPAAESIASPGNPAVPDAADGQQDTRSGVSQTPQDAATESRPEPEAGPDDTAASKDKQSSGEASGAGDSKPPVIGTPTNPYCRFCPD